MIPQLIHHIWLGTPLPDNLARLRNTWAEHHPGHEMRLWDDDAIGDLNMPYRDLYDHAPDIVPGDAVWQFRSDLARWIILRDHGGIYADTDTRCQRNIEPLLTAPMVVAWEIQDRWVGSSTLAAEPHHPATRDVIKHIDHVTRRARPGTRPNRLTGPKAISDVLRHRPDVHILDEHLWYPVRWNNPLAFDENHPNAYVVHGWGHQRELRGLPPCG